MTASVYIIQNKINNKIYVGKSIDPEKRRKSHIRVANNHKSKKHYAIHYAIAKYGEDNFSFHIIEQFEDEQECLDEECFWIEYFRSWDYDYGYNLTMGGDGMSPSIATKEKMKIALNSAETKKKLSEKFRGSKNSSSKLTEQNVIEIINKYNSDKNIKKYELAKEYGVSSTVIGKIITHKSWTHITDGYDIVVKNTGCHLIGKTSNNILEECQVVEIINKYNDGNHTYKELGKLYGISATAICSIINGVNWKHIYKKYEIENKKHLNCGERSYNSKLSENNVIDIIKLYNTGKYTFKALSIMFKVSRKNINSIILNKSWKHIDRTKI